MLRTLELLESDKYYGVKERFSHVADFGFSKSPEETFQKWGGKEVPLADMVRVIRTFPSCINWIKRRGKAGSNGFFP